MIKSARRLATITTLLAMLGALIGPPAQSRPSAQSRPPAQPNIIYIMTDDLDASLVNYMSEVLAMRSRGIDFTNFIVTNSLCCPSRAGFLTGKYPHNNRVRSNNWPTGGLGKFMKNDENESIGVYLDGAGYSTALMGKYLNDYSVSGFQDGSGGQPDFPATYVPPGWDEAWLVGHGGYQQFQYVVTEKTTGMPGKTRFVGPRKSNYLTDQLSEQAVDFINRHTGEPFFLTLAPFAAHNGSRSDPQSSEIKFPPAPRDRAASPDRPARWGEPKFPNGDCGEPIDGGCNEVVWPPVPENHNTIVVDGAAWHPSDLLDQAQLDAAKARYLDRVRMVQAVDDMIAKIRRTLAQQSITDDTYIFFGSDNGYHLGEHALIEGKTTPYDHDARVPLIVLPPGGTTARTSDAIVSNIDLLPTFASIAGVTAFDEPIDGASFRYVLDGAPTPVEARQAALIQQLRDEIPVKGDPDRAVGGDAKIPSYYALRTANYLYVDYGVLNGVGPAETDGEYFDLTADPFEKMNIIDTLTVERREALNDALLYYSTCAGPSCVSAGG